MYPNAYSPKFKKLVLILTFFILLTMANIKIDLVIDQKFEVLTFDNIALPFK